MKFGRTAFVFGNANKFWKPFKPAASINGTDMRKENLAADCLSKSLNIPPVIVTPERLMPGNNANTWNKPTLTLQCLRQILLLHHHIRVEECKTNNQ